MKKAITSIILSIVLVLTLSVSAFAAEIGGEPSLTPLSGSEIHPFSYQISPYGSTPVYCLSSSNGYFTSTPGSRCTLQFVADTNTVGAIRVTIGGVQYPAYPSSQPSGSGYSYYVVWTVDTATPYTITLTNSSAYYVNITALSVVY